MTATVDYRREIDGLRAIAVLPVVLFHAGFQSFQGGFVGVDVFFVISGYLITSIIARDIERGQFSILFFYERRIRRILPALYLVMFVSLCFAYVFMGPSDFDSFGKSLISTSAFGSNILFWQESGYFGRANELKPLLHTWSLAVEEQFYVFFPIAMLVLHRFKSIVTLLAVITVTVLSLILADWASTHFVKANFFLLPTRAWELLAGSLLAFVPLSCMRRNTLVASLGASSGLVLIGISIIYIDSELPFPGRYALLPVLGTACIILFASDKNLTGRLLGSRPLVAVGLISYSAYLWHQPILSFARLSFIEPPGHLQITGLIALAFLLAWGSWAWIEKPFRDHERMSTKRVFQAAALGGLFFVGAGMFIYWKDGLPSRFDKTALHLLHADAQHDWLPKECDRNSRLPGRGCIANAGQPQSVFLWGDSHARALSGVLADELLRNSPFSLIVSTMGGCAPILDIENWPQKECESPNRYVMEYLHSEVSPETVIIHARWVYYFQAAHFNKNIRRISSPAPERKQADWVADAFEETITALRAAGKKVVIVGGVPHADFSIPDRMFKRSIWGSSTTEPLTTSYAQFSTLQASVTETLRLYENQPDVRVVYPEQILCDTPSHSECLLELDGAPLYRDDDHLSVLGARLVVPMVHHAISELENK